MNYDPNTHHRRSVRIKDHDYSQKGLYFITLCIQNKEYLFGDIHKDDMALNDAGKMVSNQWLALTKRFSNIQLNEFIVMPNHFHGILNITNDQKINVPNGQKPKLSLNGTSPNTIGRIIQTFKSISTNEYISGVKSSSWKRFNKNLWQRNYWEHII